MRKLLLLMTLFILAMPLSAQNEVSRDCVRRQARTLSHKELSNCYIVKDARIFQVTRKPENARNRNLGMLQASYAEIFPPTLFLCREKLSFMIQGAPLQVRSTRSTLRLKKLPVSLQAQIPQNPEPLVLKR